MASEVRLVFLQNPLEGALKKGRRAHFRGPKTAGGEGLEVREAVSVFGGLPLALRETTGKHQLVVQGPPVPFFRFYFGGEGSPTKIDYRKKLVPLF